MIFVSLHFPSLLATSLTNCLRLLGRAVVLRQMLLTGQFGLVCNQLYFECYIYDSTKEREETKKEERQNERDSRPRYVTDPKGTPLLPRLCTNDSLLDLPYSCRPQKGQNRLRVPVI